MSRQEMIRKGGQRLPEPAPAGRRSAPAARGWLASPLALAFEVLVVGLFVLFAAALLLEGRQLPVPQALADRIVARGAGLIGTELDVGEVTLEPRGKGRLALRAEEVRIGGAADAIRLPAVTAELDLGALLRGARVPRFVLVEGAQLVLERRASGGIDLGFGQGAQEAGAAAQPAEALRAVLARPELAPLERIELTDAAVTLSDRGTGRVRRVENGQIALQRGGGMLAATLAAELPFGADAARVSLRLTMPETAEADPAQGARLSALIEGMPAPEIAAEVPALGWLAALDAPVSGTLIAEVDGAGRPGRIDGTLDLGSGSVDLGPGRVEAVPFDAAQLYFAYRPETARISFETLRVESPRGDVVASGHADLAGMEAGRIDAITAQLGLQHLSLDLPDVLPDPVLFDGGQIEMHVTMAPFRVEVGQIVLEGTGPAPEVASGGTGVEGEADAGAEVGAPYRLSARGAFQLRNGAWHGAADLGMSEIGPDTLLALWPFQAIPLTRVWLERNLWSGRLTETRAGVVLRPGAGAEIGLSFAFEAAEVQALRGAPPVQQGAGHASIAGDVFTLTLAEGVATPPLGGPIDLAGSVIQLDDVRAKPPNGEVRLRTDSTITAALSLLDEPPFELIAKTGRPVELAEGRARLDGTVRFPMGRGLTIGKVVYDLTGDLSDVRSRVLVPGRTVAADRLRLSATPRGLEIAGAAELEGLPLNAVWAQPFGPGSPPAEVRATFALGPEAAEILDLGLPPGSLSGAAEAEALLRVPREGAVAVTLSSDLQGLRLSIPGLGWSKSEGRAGTLRIEGQLGTAAAPAVFDSLVLEAPGLSAEGELRLAQGGGLDVLDLTRARLGGWFDGRVRLRGRGAGRAPAIEIPAGRLDVTAAPFGQAGGAAFGGPISARLDRLVLSEDAALTDFRADLDRNGGLSGSFEGRVNGGPVLRGTVRPGTGGRPALRLRAEEAGRTLQAAGVFDEAEGGTLDLDLRPEAALGTWRGQLTVESFRLTSAPEVAALLNAISVVGLIEQFNGPGLLFTSLRADFRISPRVVQILEASAVGPSVGISADGLFDLRNSRLDIQGVISPIFAINSIGQVFSREGEGLFGFNYRIRGDADDPEVSVNPLSVLTPGVFREIFRSNPPSLQQRDN